MIEIIKHGTKHTAICFECGCKFSYEDEDVLNDTLDYKTVRTYVNCPQCDKKVM